MELKYAFFASFADVAPDGRFSVIGGGVDGMLVPLIPVVIPSIAILVNVQFLPAECGVDYGLRVMVSTEGLPDVYIDANANLSPRHAPHDSPESDPVSVKAALNFYGLPVVVEKPIRFALLVNDRPIGGLSLGIKVAPRTSETAS